MYLRHVLAHKINSSLDLFLLALIDSGVSTAYAFKDKAGLSVGATLPAVRRLVKSGYVVRGEKLARSRQNLELTSAGRREFKIALKRLMLNFQEHPPSDTESLLRICSLGLHFRKRGSAKKLLQGAAEDRSIKAQKVSGKFPKLETDLDLASTYRVLAACCTVASLRAEAIALTSITRQLAKIAK